MELRRCAGRVDAQRGSRRHRCLSALVTWPGKPCEHVPQRGQLSHSESRDQYGEVALDPRVAIACVRGVELVGITDPDEVRVLLDVVELTCQLQFPLVD